MRCCSPVDPSMAWSRYLPLILLVFLIGAVSASASSSISGDVFDAHGSVTVGRALLQAKKGCPVNFEYLNYTIITSQCKGPKYPPKLCCGAFKEFACPYADQLNDLSNDCASTMFSYINLYGKYPPGLFASECREGKEGLACPALPPGQPANDTSAATPTFSTPLTLTLIPLLLLISQML